MGPPVSRGVRRRGPPDQRRPRLRAQARRRTSTRWRRSTRRKGKYLSYHEAASAARATVDVLPDVLGEGAARSDVSEADALGRAARGRQGRVRSSAGRFAGCCSSTAAASCRSRSRARRSRRARACRTSRSGAVTYGHRFLATSGRAGRAIKVRSFDEYRKKLTENFVLLSRIERRDRILRDLEAQARRIGGRACCSSTPQAEALLEEVPDLVEFPAVVAGAFSAEFLDAARGSADDDADSSSAFLPGVSADRRADAGVSGGHQHADRPTSAPSRPTPSASSTARLRDARFFWDADRQIGLEARLDAARDGAVPQAARVVPREGGAHRDAGALDRGRRLRPAGRWPTPAARAARLAKADLATDMVREFTELQGTMGGIYAREAGEPEAVWKAIYYHYLPIGGRGRRGADGRRARRRRASRGRPCRWPTSSTRSSACSSPASGRPGRAIRSACAARRTAFSASCSTPRR